MNDLQHYNSAIMAKRELDQLFGLYKVPDEAKEAMVADWRHEDKVPEHSKKAEYDWKHSLEQIIGRSNAFSAISRIEQLATQIKEARTALADIPLDGFTKRCNELLREIRLHSTDSFYHNEGKQFDFAMSVRFKRKDEENWSVSFYQNGSYWHGNNRISQWKVDVRIGPKYLRSVHEHFRFFMNGKNKCWVLDADEIEGHVFNDHGYRVFRAQVFGFNGNKEPETYSLYIIDAPDYKDENGSVLYAHGDTVNGALNLLKRRIKSETLKRLSI